MYITSVQRHKDFEYFLAATKPGRSTTIEQYGVEVQEPNLPFEPQVSFGICSYSEEIFHEIAFRLRERFLDPSINSVNWEFVRLNMNEESFIQDTEDILLAQIEGVKWPEIMGMFGIPRDEDPYQVKLKKIFQFYFKAPNTPNGGMTIRAQSDVEEIIDVLRAEHFQAIQQLEILMCYYEDLQQHSIF